MVGGGSGAQAAGGGVAVFDDGGAGTAGVDAGFSQPDCGGAQCGVCVDAAGAGEGSVRDRMGGSELDGEEFVFNLPGALPSVSVGQCGVCAVCTRAGEVAGAWDGMRLGG